MVKVKKIQIPLLPILVWIDLNTSLTWIIDYFVIVSMIIGLIGYLINYFLNWLFGEDKNELPQPKIKI